jgi:hypothetical protein
LRNLAIIAVLALLSGSLGAADSIISFQPAVAFDLGGSDDLVAVADFDGDGDLDVAGGARGTIRIFLNDGSGVFTAGATVKVPTGVSHLLAGDLTGDGVADLVVPGDDLWFRSEKIAILRNDGTGQFAESVVAAPFWTNRPALLADVEGDGDLDLVLIREKDAGSPGLVILENDGSGGMTPDAIGIDTPGDVEQFAFADVNGDGRPDLVLTHGRVALGDGAGGFGEFQYSAGPTRVDWVLADMDGDDVLDIVGAEPSPVREDGVYLFRGNGDGTFEAQEFTPGPIEGSGSPPFLLHATDLDGDGDPDLVCAGIDNFVAVVPNLGDGEFGATLEFRLRGETGSDGAAWIQPADLDGDGRPELLVGQRRVGALLLEPGMWPGPALSVVSPADVPSGGERTITLQGVNLGAETEVRLLDKHDRMQEDVAQVLGTNALTPTRLEVSLMVPPVDITEWSVPSKSTLTVEVENPGGLAAHLRESFTVENYAYVDLENVKGRVKMKNRARRDQFKLKARFSRRDDIEKFLSRAGQDMVLRVGFGEGLLTVEVPGDDPGWVFTEDQIFWRSAPGRKPKVRLKVSGRPGHWRFAAKVSRFDFPAGTEEELRFLVVLGGARVSASSLSGPVQNGNVRMK